MAIITLTTDLGDKDFYQSALKGSIMSLLPGVNLIDITHNIAPFNIQQGAFILKNAFTYFPGETVHLVGIDSVYNQNTRYLAIRYKDHFFVGSDNGIFSLMFEDHAEEIVELNIIQDLKFLHFPLTDILAKAACHLAKGGKIKDIGVPVTTLEEKVNLQPVIERDIIRGSVIYIDSFQNVITNITRDLFTKVQQNRGLILYFRKNESI
jgi:S-adenosylmethionine hydrolase